MPLFNRVVSVRIGTPGSSDGLSIDGLRVTFDVEKTITPDPNTAKISIFKQAADIPLIAPTNCQ